MKQKKTGKCGKQSKVEERDEVGVYILILVPNVVACHGLPPILIAAAQCSVRGAHLIGIRGRQLAL